MFLLFPVKTHDEGVHAGVVAEDVLKCQVQGTGENAKASETFFCVCEFRITSALFPEDL
jgi:hypothetical protein